MLILIKWLSLETHWLAAVKKHHVWHTTVARTASRETVLVFDWSKASMGSMNALISMDLARPTGS